MTLTLTNKAITRMANHLRENKGQVNKTAQDDNEDLSYLDTDINYHVDRLVSIILESGTQALEDYINNLSISVGDHVTETYFKSEVHDRFYEMVLEDLEVLDRRRFSTPGRISQVIDPVEQLFGYVMGTLVNMLESHKQSPDKADANACASVLEQVIDVIDPLEL